MFLMDGDIDEALITLHTIKGRYIPPPSDATTTSNFSPTHPSNPSSASIWDDKVADLFTWFNNLDSRLLGTALDSQNCSISNFIAPVTSGKWIVTVWYVFCSTLMNFDKAQRVVVAKTSFLTACLSKFGLETQTHSTPPGCLYVTTPNSRLIRAAFSPSHAKCFLRCKFIPNNFTQPTRMAIPGWYHMTHGLYSCDTAYGLSYQGDTLTLLVASR